MEGIYEFGSLPIVSATELAESYNKEQNVYDASYDGPTDTINYGSCYVEPPNEVEKLFISPDGRRINRLHRDDIR